MNSLVCRTTQPPGHRSVRAETNPAGTAMSQPAVPPRQNSCPLMPPLKLVPTWNKLVSGLQQTEAVYFLVRTVCCWSSFQTRSENQVSIRMNKWGCDNAHRQGQRQEHGSNTYTQDDKDCHCFIPFQLSFTARQTNEKIGLVEKNKKVLPS